MMQRARRFVRGYRDALADFSANATHVLVSQAMQNVAYGILLIVLGLFVVARTGSDVVLGRAEAATSFALALVCLLAAPLITMNGYKRILIFAAVCYAVARFGQVVAPFAIPIIMFGFVAGVGDGITQTVIVPFLSENSKERHRDYLFSMDLFSRVAGLFVGCLLGGLIPAALALLLDHTVAYQITVAVAAALYAASAWPLLKVREQHLFRSPRKAWQRYYATIRRFRSWKHLGTLVIPQFTIAVGAGITIPFVSRYLQHNMMASDTAIGVIQGITQLFVAIAALFGPTIKRRLGTRWSLVIIQTLSLPFLCAIPSAPTLFVLAPILWARSALMNMSWPLFNQYSMAGVSSREKPIIGAAIGFSWAVGQIFGALVGGQLMHAGAGGYAYYITAGIYLIGIFFMGAMIKDKPLGPPKHRYIGEGEFVADTAQVDESTASDERV